MIRTNELRSAVAFRSPTVADRRPDRWLHEIRVGPLHLRVDVACSSPFVGAADVAPVRLRGIFRYSFTTDITLSYIGIAGPWVFAALSDRDRTYCSTAFTY